MTKKTFTLDNIQDLRKPGLYFLYKDDILVYIGVSKNIYVRVLEHCFENKKDFDSLKIINQKTDSNHTATEIMEVFLINKFKPKYNKLIVDDIFTFYHTMPSTVVAEVGENNYDKALQLFEKIADSVHKKGYEK